MFVRFVFWQYTNIKQHPLRGRVR